MTEQTKYEIVKRFVDNGERNYKRLASLLNSTLKTAYNLVNKYKELGKEGFVHGNHKHKPSTTISNEIKNKIKAIYQNISSVTDVNFTHFNLILKRDYGIKVSYTFLYTFLTSFALCSPKCNRATKSKRNQKIRQKLADKIPLTDIEKDIVADHLVDPKVAHPRKERSKYFGELLQMDASKHNWFSNFKTQLHLAIDDCTGRIVGAYFDKEETLNGYYHITKQFLTKYGIPARILTDNRTIFNYRKKGKNSEERDTFTQYGFMCHRLGISLETSSIPQVKGRVERVFGTLQSRLVAELKLKKVETIDQANEFLAGFLESFNQEFSLPYNDTINAFENQLDSIDLDEYLAVVCKRKVDNGHHIKYDKKEYRLINDNGIQVFPYSGAECLVIRKFNSEIVAMLEHNVYHLEIFEEHRKDSYFEPIKPKVRKQYKPGLKHPWKKKFYEDYLKFYRKKLQNNYTYLC